MVDKKQWMDFYNTHRITLFLWLGFALYLSLYCLISTNSDGVTIIYYKAASYWLSSQNVYLDTCPAFVYFPQSAVLFLPFALLPFKVSNVLWHVFLTGLFASSLFALVSMTHFPKKQTYLGLSLLMIPTAMGALGQGQIGVLVTSLLFYMLYAIYNRRWWAAAVLLGLAVAYKPTCLVFFGLFFAIYPSMRLKSVAIVAAGLVFPFFFQTPGYVLEQYHNYYATTQTLVTFSNSLGWANIWTLIRSTTDVVVPSDLSHAISMVVAGLTLVISYLAYKMPNSEKYSFWYIYALGGLYLMLFNPRTENNNYMMVMPVFILFCYYYWYDLKEKWLYIPSAICVLFIGFNHSISHLLHIDNLIIRPVCILLLGAQLLVVLRNQMALRAGAGDNPLAV